MVELDPRPLVVRAEPNLRGTLNGAGGCAGVMRRNATSKGVLLCTLALWSWNRTTMLPWPRTRLDGARSPW